MIKKIDSDDEDHDPNFEPDSDSDEESVDSYISEIEETKNNIISDAGSRGSEVDDETVDDETELISLDFDEEYDDEDYFDFDEEEFLEELKETDPLLYEEFIKVQTHLEKGVPNVIDILKSPFTVEEKAKLIELIEIFLSLDPTYIEWLQMKQLIQVEYQQISSRYSQLQKLDPEIRDKYIEDLKSIENYEEKDIDFKILTLGITLREKSYIYQRYKKGQELKNSDENGKVNEWLYTVLKIPFGIYKTFSDVDIIMNNAKRIMDEELYGMTLIKEQLLIYVYQKIINPTNKEYVLGLVGEQGTGKTSIALLISKCLNIPFYQISGNILSNSDCIHGHDYTYLGSTPGIIARGLIQMKYNNGIFFIDEFEKINLEKSYNSILEILDPVQNNCFKDNYIGDIAIDISKIFFICAMNEPPKHSTIRDRMFIINVPEYSYKEKFEMVKSHIIPRLLKEIGISVRIEDSAISLIIDKCNQNKGMRQIIHRLKNILSTIQFTLKYPQLSSLKLKDFNNRVGTEIVSAILDKIGDDYRPSSMYN